MCYCWRGDHRSIAQRRDTVEGETTGTDKTKGTRADNSAIVKFHLLSASQEYTQKKKKEEKYLHGRGLKIERWSFPFECLHFSYALFQKTSLSSRAVRTETELKVKNPFRCSQCCLPVLFSKTIINLQTSEASRGINQHQKGMKTRSMDF